MAVLRTQLEIKADIRNIQRDVQYLHYLITRKSATSAAVAREPQERDERITQYVPCATIEELKNLNRKLETDADFLRHSVSYYNHPVVMCAHGLVCNCYAFNVFQIEFFTVEDYDRTVKKKNWRRL